MMGQGIGQGVGMGQMGQGIQQQGQYYEQNIPQSQVPLGQNVPLQQQQGFGQGIQQQGVTSINKENILESQFFPR